MLCCYSPEKQSPTDIGDDDYCHIKLSTADKGLNIKCVFTKVSMFESGWSKIHSDEIVSALNEHDPFTLYVLVVEII